MAEFAARERELVFCHACQNDWVRDQNGLQCPGCHSDVVEIIDERHDPRDDHIDTSDEDNGDVNLTSPDNHPHRPLRHHNPWAVEPPDPDDSDIEHVEWNPAPGVHFARTSFRSSPPGLGQRGQSNNDPFAPLFQSISTIFEDAANAQPQGRLRGPNPTHIHRPEFASQNPFPHHQHHHPPWTTGPPGGRQVFTASGRIWPQNGPNAPPNDENISNLHNVLATMLQSMQANMVTGPLEHGDQGRMPNLSTFITQMLGGVHGDAVYSEEALDRIITQMMDQTHGSTAPGPASAAAIAALPRKPAEKDIMDQDGKAECSVCMDAVNIGDEITVLPCKHWFHGECVSAWLKEHDTCPHCRQGIMPKDGQPDILRSPDQAPRHSQNNFSNSNRANESASTREQSGLSQQPPMPGTLQEAHMQQHIPGGFLGYPDSQEYVQRQRHHSPQSPPTLPQRQQSHRRRNSARSNGNGSEGSSGGQGVTGWFRSLRGGSNSADR